MKRSVAIVLCVLGLGSAIAAALATQPEATKPTSLSGRLTDESGKPVAGVAIQLYSGFATRFEGQRTVTDDDGRYTFDPLTTGGGREGVMAPGIRLIHDRFVSSDGQSWWDVEIPFGHSLEKNFTMIRGGHISGTLTYGSGDWTLRDFNVRLVSTDKQRTAYAKTDNRGQFTTDALFPGEYIVQANESRLDYTPIVTLVVEPGATVAFKARCTFSMTAERIE